MKCQKCDLNLKEFEEKILTNMLTFKSKKNLCFVIKIINKKWLLRNMAYGAFPLLLNIYDKN